jgi:hypothetical protein
MEVPDEREPVDLVRADPCDLVGTADGQDVIQVPDPAANYSTDDQSIVLGSTDEIADLLDTGASTDEIVLEAPEAEEIVLEADGIDSATSRELRTRKRGRKLTARQEEEDRKRAFRASQKVLRMNAPSLCIKDALSRSMTVQEATNSQPPEQVASPGTPQLAVHDITTRFLMKVQSSRTMTIDNILRKEKTLQNVTNTTSLSLFSDHAASELVLEDENANAAAPAASTAMSVMSDKLDDLDSWNKPQGKRLDSNNDDENETDAEQDRITAQLRRKHEMLRLRSSIAPLQGSALKQHTAVATPLPASPLSAPASLLSPGSLALVAPKKPQEASSISHGGMLSMPSLASRQAGLQQRAASFLKVVSGDVQLLKRTNSFENCSSKPIVFSASEKAKKPSGSATQP